MKSFKQLISIIHAYDTKFGLTDKSLLGSDAHSLSLPPPHTDIHTDNYVGQPKKQEKQLFSFRGPRNLKSRFQQFYPKTTFSIPYVNKRKGNEEKETQCIKTA